MKLDQSDGPPPPIGASDGADASLLLETAVRVYAIRRERDRIFGELAALFRDPAWDIMIDLFIHSLAGKPAFVGGAAIASRIPGTTALRYISHLVEAGLVERRPDPMDGRRAQLSLTGRGMALMREALAPLAPTLGQAELPGADGGLIG